MSWRGMCTLYALVFLLLSAAGCVTPAGKQATDASSQAQAPERDQLAAVFLEKGKALEAQGDLLGALRQYRIALTVREDALELREGVRRLEEILLKQAEERFQAGLAFHEQGKYGDARREFLMALRIYPEHSKAAGMLVSRKRVRSTRYVMHTISSGESLSQIAERYYGDYRKFPEIARYNNLSDATRILVGQELKIPEIEGVPFNPGGVQVQTEEKTAPEFGLWEWGEIEASRSTPAPVSPKDEDNAGREEGQIEECRTRGIELYKKKKDRQALQVLGKVLEASPNDEVALDYAFKAQFRLAEGLMARKDYLGARDGFLASLQFKNDCAQCHEKIKKTEELYKEVHYRKGMQYFNQEKLREAVREWEKVQRMDPDYKRVGYLIEKAQKIQEKLQDLKKEQ